MTMPAQENVQPRLLLDTNIVIAHENDGPVPEAGAGEADELVRLARGLRFELLVSSGSRRDFTRATAAVAAKRVRLLEKYYRTLDSVPESPQVRAQFPIVLSENDAADVEVLSTFATGLPTALVTSDDRMKRRARAAGLTNVFTVAEAIEWLGELVEPALDNAADARVVPAYTVDARLGLFDSLRADYQDFDAWWAKVVREERAVIVLGSAAEPGGVAVLKAERDAFGLGPRVLKVSTFKVDDRQGRSRRGELLLRAVADYAVDKRFPVAYLTAWPRHQVLLTWLTRFGFVDQGATPEGEHLMVKRFQPAVGDEPLAPLEHAVRYGPRSLRVERAHVVPIQARFAARLLPDSDPQGSLFANEPCGNAIRKAYLCHAPSRKLRPGHLLVFLRTATGRPATATAVGVVEETLLSGDPGIVAAFVRGRTVYSFDEINLMCRSGPVLSILFRLDRGLDPPWQLETLVAARVMRRSPQSIAEIPEDGVAWVRHELGA